MTPYRTCGLIGYAVGSIKSIALVPVDGAGAVGAAVIAALAWAFGAANVALLWIVLLAMLMDLIAGSLAAVIDPLQSFAWQQLYGGMVGKLFRLMIIPAASLVDWLYIVSPAPLPGGYEDAFPVTLFIMIALAAAELTSVFNKFKDGGVAPGMIAPIMRHLDRLKVGSEPPARRDYDKAAIAAERERERQETQHEED